jgi:hypothetical protein
VSILLIEKKILFTYFIELQVICAFLPNQQHVERYVLEDLSNLEYVEIMPMVLLQIEMCVKCDLSCDLNV